MIRLASISMVFGVLGCTERVNVCNNDSDCTDPAYPFCDVNGEYAESGHTEMSCSITPASCPVERCGCTPGAKTCSGDELSTCNADGRSASTESCSLGCAADGQRCQIFDASNGLTTQLLASANAPDVVLPDGARINTASGIVLDSANHQLPVESVVVAQPTGPAIRVFLGHSWKMTNATVTGENLLGIVAVGPIELDGVLDAAARWKTGGPGAGIAGDCVGLDSKNGGGGGGNASAGASGGHRNEATYGLGGAAVSTWSPLLAGCKGGDSLDTSGNVTSYGGGGGGGIQLASLTRISLGPSSVVDTGGGGGGGEGGGGGAAGTMLIEAPVVDILGGVYMNGGAGGGCSFAGENGPRSLDGALAGGTCGSHNGTGGGRGGTTTQAPTIGRTEGTIGGGGGGGAAGRMRIGTRDGTANLHGAAISAVSTTVVLNPR